MTKSKASSEKDLNPRSPRIISASTGECSRTYVPAPAPGGEYHNLAGSPTPHSNPPTARLERPGTWHANRVRCIAEARASPATNGAFQCCHRGTAHNQRMHPPIFTPNYETSPSVSRTPRPAAAPLRFHGHFRRPAAPCPTRACSCHPQPSPWLDSSRNRVRSTVPGW